MATYTESPDYIVVGGGTSSLVTASRLSEDPAVRVLVLEAGQDHSADPGANIPAFWTSLLASELDLQYQTVIQSGLGGRTISEPQGKVLGGSSATNCQAFIDPSQADIDAWAKLGNPSCIWETLAPAYKKLRTLIPPADQATLGHLGIDWIDCKYCGVSRSVEVSFPSVIQNPLCKGRINAFVNLDKATTADSKLSWSAYGQTLLQNPNVQVITGARLHRLVLAQNASGEFKATGVEASVEDSKIQTYSSSREIIVAAGAFNSPKILELSGIKDKRLLDRHGIASVIDLPGVGGTLQDHLMTGVSFEVVDGINTGYPLMRQEPEALSLAQKLYIEHRAGPFTVGGTRSHAFMPPPDAALTKLLGLPVPDNFQAEILRESISDNQRNYEKVVRSILKDPNEASAAWFLFLAQANLHEGSKSFIGTNFLPQNFASIGCSRSRPLSRVSTYVSSADVTADPIIDPQYFSHLADLEIMARHLQALEGLRQSKALAHYFKPEGVRNHNVAHKIGSRDGAKKYILVTATTTIPYLRYCSHAAQRECRSSW
ncbi:hypothetical protein S40288_09622 [Stachybotrys chartarum IBT 40288]|nr:hypothetical protein S40288_09622 [Stachybotrys chartarum IBT 40288]